MAAGNESVIQAILEDLKEPKALKNRPYGAHVSIGDPSDALLWV